MAAESKKKIAKSLIFALLAELESENEEISDIECDSVSETSSEEDFSMIVNEMVKMKQNNNRSQDFAEIAGSLSNSEFKRYFRMYPTTFEIILTMIAPEIKNVTPLGRKTIAPHKQLLMTIWLISTLDSYRSISNRFSVTKSSIWESANRVWKSLVNHAAEIIKWPTDSEKEQIIDKFKNISGFPDVVGCVDVCQINIKAPRKNAEAYINRKNVHSFNLQAVCDNNCVFLDTYAEEVGSVHKAMVYRRSELGNTIAEKTLDKHILGDSTYPLSTNLLTPFRDNGHLSNVEKNYNYIHSQTRYPIERAFALLKGRFHRLKFLDMLRTEKIPLVITACCVLHNICQTLSDKAKEFIETTEDFSETNSESDDDYETEDQDISQSLGSEKRNLIAQNLPLENV